MSEARFDFSGLPSSIEWYQCYNDLSKKNWVDGSELTQNVGSWDERAIAKWHFFYRPYAPKVGRPQKKMTNERRIQIRVYTEYSNRSRSLIQAAQRRAVNLATWIVVWCVVLGLWTAKLVADESTAGALVCGTILVLVVRSLYRRRRAQNAEIDRLKSLVTQYDATVSRCQAEIRLLEDEIKQLLAQIPRPPDGDRIGRWYEEELGNLELGILGDLAGTQVTRETAGRYLTRSFGDRRVLSLLIDSWGFLQPATQRGPLGPEGTGLRRARADLGDRIETWQVGRDDAPIFRLWFLQFILPFPKNLNTCSFFYDFITRRRYGLRLETFQYNHVTNYAIRELDPNEEEVDALASRQLKAKRLTALLIAVASGNHFRCVLVDDDVFDFLNESLRNEEKFRQLADELPSVEDLRQRIAGAAPEQLVALQAEEQQRLEAEMKAIAEEHHQLRLATAGRQRAREVIEHVRACVENYVLQVERPA